MNYIFGRIDKKDILKTVGPQHSDLTGWNTVVVKTDVDTTTDSFLVVEKYHHDEDAEGNCYDWYEITNHYRIVEHGERVSALETQTKDIENAMCDTDIDMDERLAEIENALCELDERG